jgi:hypothetical protein
VDPVDPGSEEEYEQPEASTLHGCDDDIPLSKPFKLKMYVQLALIIFLAVS